MDEEEEEGVDKEAVLRAQEQASGPGPSAQWYRERISDAYTTAFVVHDRIVNNPALPEEIAEQEGAKAFDNIIRHAYD